MASNYNNTGFQSLSCSRIMYVCIAELKKAIKSFQAQLSHGLLYASMTLVQM